MAGRPFRITLDNGEEYEVPEENAHEAMKALDRRGLKFDATEALGEMTVGEPEVIKSSPKTGSGASGSWDAPDPLVQFGRDAQEYLRPGAKTAYDAVGGALHGASGGLGDEVLGLLSPELGQQAKQQMAASQQRSPTAFAVGDVAGSVAMPQARVMKGAGMVPAIANQAATGGMQGAMRGYGDSEGDAGDRALAAFAEGGQGAALGGGIAGAVGGLGKAAGALAPQLGAAADKARTAAFGASGADLRKLADSRGLEFAEGNIARQGEALGVSNKLMPVSTSEYAKRFAGKQEEASQSIAQSLQDAEAQGVKGPGFISEQPIVDALRAKEAAALRSPYGDRQAQASAFGQVGDAAAGQSISTPTQLRGMKSGYDQRAYPNQLQGSSESFMGQAHKTAGDAARGQLREAMSYALPETEQAFAKGNQQYGTAAVLEETARNKAAQQYSGGGMLGNLGAGAIGAGVGATFGGAEGAISGAALGFARPALSAAQQYGPDLGANLGRLGERAMGGAAGPMQSFAQKAPIGQLAGGQQGPDPLEQMGASLAKSQENARGHLLPQVIQDLLQSNPAELGPYASQFAQAAGAEGEGNLAGLIERLSRTDPRFRSEFLPRLNAMTGDR